MNENWVITYDYNTGVESNKFTAPSILDAIHQCCESGVLMSHISEVKLEDV